MNLERILVRLRQIFLTFGSALAVVGALVMGLSFLRIQLVLHKVNEPQGCKLLLFREEQ